MNIQPLDMLHQSLQNLFTHVFFVNVDAFNNFVFDIFNGLNI